MRWSPGSPLRRRVAVSSLLALLLAAGAWFGPRWAERRIRARIESEAARRGLRAEVRDVRVGLFPPLAVSGLRIDKPAAWSLAVESARLTLRVWGRGFLGRSRLTLGRVSLAAGGMTLDATPTRWRIEGAPRGGLRALMEQPAAGSLVLTRRPAEGGAEIDLVASGLPAGKILTLRRRAPLLDAGELSGTTRFRLATGSVHFEGDLRSQGVRVASLSNVGPTDERPAFGPPNVVGLRLRGTWNGPVSTLDLARWQLATEGAVLSGSLRVEDLSVDPRIDLALEVERVDFGHLLASAGLDQPKAVAARAGGPPRDGDLGSASLSARFRGRLADPASFVVSQRLDFTPPRRPLPAIERLRGDFTHEVVSPAGERKTIRVSADSPDFMALADVPPLFVRTLLLGEDSSFFGHAGVDLSELPFAVLTNWARGGAVRGASTISQQLAKNLFLSHDKNLGRKLQELSLALLLEAGLGKQRILEIYVNVIEWGPGLYGLRPAARHYFTREPGELRPAQMALLVSLVPAPVGYQRSLASGRPSAGFRLLVDGLLAKLRSVDLLTEEEYETALADELAVKTGPDAPTYGRDPDDTIPSYGPPS
jgi:penicillin-binding protein 1A